MLETAAQSTERPSDSRSWTLTSQKVIFSAGKTEAAYSASLVFSLIE